jgi:hypothetical protein
VVPVECPTLKRNGSKAVVSRLNTAWPIPIADDLPPALQSKFDFDIGGFFPRAIFGHLP